MTDRQWTVVLRVAMALMVLAIASASLAQQAPLWVANAPAVGFVNCAPTTTLAGGAVPLGGLSLVQITADTDTRVSFWNYNGASWQKLSPRWGHAATDSTVFIAAGTTETYWFGSPYLKAIYLTSGTAYFKGE